MKKILIRALAVAAASVLGVGLILVPLHAWAMSQGELPLWVIITGCAAGLTVIWAGGAVDDWLRDSV